MGGKGSRQWPGEGTHNQTSLLGLPVAVRYERESTGGLRRLIRSEYPCRATVGRMHGLEFTCACGEGGITRRERTPRIL